MADREKIEAVAKSYHDLMSLQRVQRATMAKMLRACIARLKSHDPVKRTEAITGLSDLADMLERQA